MSENKLAKKFISATSISEKKRRKRELVLSICILFLIVILTLVESRTVNLGIDLPVSSTILMFILMNINILLLILLLFLVFRNLVKLMYDRSRKVLGAKLRTRLVIAFIMLTLLPSTVLFFFSLKFITNSIEFWFSIPIEETLESSLNVGRRLYSYAEEHNRFYIKQVAYQLKKRELLNPEKRDELSQYIQVVQRYFNIHAVEIYSTNTDRITFAIDQQLEDNPFSVISADNLQKAIPPSGVRSITEAIENGELIRTIGTTPFGIEPASAAAFIVLTDLIPPDLSEDLAGISSGFNAYKERKLYKKFFQISFYIALSIVALLVVFSAIWYGFRIAQSISIPIMELAEGTKKVAEGDLSFTIDLQSDDEIGSLVNSFNKMTRDLRANREQLERSAQMLSKQNIEIEEKRQYMEIVLKNVSTGVITIDADGVITTMNKSAERMLNLSAKEVMNKNYKMLLGEPHLKLAEEAMRSLASTRDNAIELPVKLSISGKPRSFAVNVNALKSDTEKQLGIIIVFDDLTELEKAQRVTAWRNVARRIAHEVKNPLTPIKLSAQRLKRKFAKTVNDPIFDECTGMIIDHVDIIRNLVNEFSTFAKFPTSNLRPDELPPIINETLALYREGYPNVNFEFSIKDEIPRLNLDRQQIKQALINLIDNAIASIRASGKITIILTHDPILKLIRLELSDDGEGLSDEVKMRLFEPNFSTKKTGMGLGLTIVSTIVSDHKGMIQVQDNHPRGARFVVELPVPDLNLNKSGGHK
ncbi:MAG: PAS domain-containing protein [Desulfobacterales bacterium]|nr:PAS domain-containing protein [Desulfobacterales bacterium]